jgi:hypothetical protein
VDITLGNLLIISSKGETTQVLKCHPDFFGHSDFKWEKTVITERGVGDKQKKKEQETI